METLLAGLIEANGKTVFSPSQIKKVNKILTALSGLHLFATGLFWSRSLGISRIRFTQISFRKVFATGNDYNHLIVIL